MDYASPLKIAAHSAIVSLQIDIPILSRRVASTSPDISARYDFLAVTLYVTVHYAPDTDAAMEVTTGPSNATTATDRATGDDRSVAS